MADTGWGRRVRLRVVVLFFAVVSLINIGVAPAAGPDPTRDQSQDRPNIIVVLTDDQRRAGTGRVMRELNRRIARRGIKFQHAFVSIPLCCPSRASLLTGRYAHNHRVQGNDDAYNMDHETTLQRHLKDAGYRTAIFGKFLNSWNLEDDPPHFDEWKIFSVSNNTGYYGGEWNVNGLVRTVDTYSTDYIARSGATFIKEAESEDRQPWFAYLAPAAPHSPSTPEPAHARWDPGPWQPNLAARERDRSDKPPWVRRLDSRHRHAAKLRRQQLRTMRSVDDLVALLDRTLRATGEARNTVFLFASDNGYMWGEHGLTGNVHGKRAPYTHSISIPLMLRWPAGVNGDTTDRRLVSVVDIAPTLLDAAGVSEDVIATMDGRSLLTQWTRERLLIEYWEEQEVPTWASTRTRRYQYTEYYDESGVVSFREYYDLFADRYQLTNLLHDGRSDNDPEYQRLSLTLQGDRSCVAASCP